MPTTPIQIIQSNTKEQPFHEVPYLPLENADQDTRHGAHFFRNVKQLSVGFGSKVFRVDRDGMWAGAEDFASAPWKVDWNGNMTATSVTISGYIPTGGALTDIGAGNITNTYLGANSISSGNIQANAVIAGKIAANAVTATEINVSTLSAISANIGTVTAGTLSAVSISGATITGTTLTTASSGQRVVLTSTLAQFYNSSGTEIVDTYAASNSYIIKGMQSASSIYFDHGSTGTTAFLANGTIKAVFNGGSGAHFSPFSNGGLSLGQSGAAWDGIFLIGTLRYQATDQAVVYWGYVSGTTLSPDNTTWSVTNPSTGIYTVTHGLGHTNYVVNVTPFASVVKNITVSGRTTTTFTVRVANLSDALENNDWMFTLYEQP